jgi:hypothetical protein
MGCRTRPAISLGTRRQSRAHWILLDISNRRQQMSILQCNREETALPNVPFELFHAVEVLGVAHMKRLERSMQTFWRGWHQDEMDVVRHQAISQDHDLVLRSVFAHPLQVDPVVPIGKEDLLASIAALSDVVRNVLDYDAWLPRHRATLCGLDRGREPKTRSNRIE